MAKYSIEMNAPGPDTGSNDEYGINSRVQIVANKAGFRASLAAGALIAQLYDPYAKLGVSTFVTLGTVPPQLALSGSTIVKGAGVAVAGTDYRIFIKASAADGWQSVTSQISFTAGA